MKLLNKMTHIIEYNGPLHQFTGVESYRHAETNTEFEILLSKDEQRELLRNRISTEAGDTQSLLGTTADGMQLLFYAFSQLNLALSTADSLEEVRAAAAPFNELATSFLSKLDAGEVKLPFQAKGIENVVADIESRATAVYDTLNNSQEDKS